MRRLLPTAAPISLGDAYPDVALDGAPWVAMGMVTSVDGAVEVGGTSGPLGAAGDGAAFRALRSLADVVLVGATTAAAEDYRPDPAVRHPERRAALGQAPRPRIAVVTGSGEVDPSARLYGDPEHVPLVVTTSAGARVVRERVGDRAEVVEVAATDDGHPVPAAVRTALVDRGLPRIVAEGGPSLNHALVTAGVVDELFVTIAPTLVGTSGVGIAGPQLVDGPVRLVLHELRVHGSELVCRYRVLPAA